MSPEEIKKILMAIKNGKITPSAAMEKLKGLPFSDLNFAKLDHHRHLRRGFPEVVFCEKKTLPQVVSILGEILKKNRVVLGTRVSDAMYRELQVSYPDAVYREAARAVVVDRRKKKPLYPGAGITLVTAGTSDIPVAEEAALMPEILGIRVNRLYDVGVAGLHRLLEFLPRMRKSSCIIAIAGMDGVLPGVITGLTDVPVVGVPTSVGYGANFQGIAPLLTMLNSCSCGLAVMNIDNGFGAGYFAANLVRRMKL